MSKRQKLRKKSAASDPYKRSDSSRDGNAWVLASKCIGDNIAGWRVEAVDRNNVRRLDTSERCDVTSYCYPTGAKLVQATLMRAQA